MAMSEDGLGLGGLCFEQPQHATRRHRVVGVAAGQLGKDFLFDPSCSNAPKGVKPYAREGDFVEAGTYPSQGGGEISLQSVVAFENQGTSVQPEGWPVVVYAFNTTEQEEEEFRSYARNSSTFDLCCTLCSTTALGHVQSERFYRIFGFFDVTPKGAESNLHDASIYDPDINRLELPGNLSDQELATRLTGLQDFDPARKPQPARFTLGVDYVLLLNGQVREVSPPIAGP